MQHRKKTGVGFRCQTSFHGLYLAPERLSLLFNFQFVVLRVTKFALDSFTQLVELLRLLLQLIHLVLFVLTSSQQSINQSINQSIYLANCATTKNKCQQNNVKHSDGLPEKQNRSSQLIAQISTKFTQNSY